MKRGKKAWLVTLGYLAAWAVLPAGASIIIDNFSPAANDRFADDPAFIGTGYDWTGVGRTTSSRWGTLVSPNVFLSANHYHPAESSTFQFYPGNDPNASPVTRTVASGQRIGSSDLWIGVLNAPVSDGIVNYSFSTVPIASFDDFVNSSIAGQTSWMFGLSPSSFPTTVDMAVGRNVLDRWFNITDSGGNVVDHAVGAVRDSDGTGNYVASEAYLQGGDSGGPMFTIDGGSGDLVLTGINWFINDAGVTPQYSGFSYTGNYATEIQSYIDAHPVPETGSVLVWGMVVMVVVFRRGRTTAGKP